jgi:hypothetical protein
MIRSFQILWHQVDIDIETSLDGDQRVQQALRVLVPSATHEFPPLRRIQYQLRPSQNVVIVYEEHDELGRVQSTIDLLDLLFTRIFRRLFEHASRSGWVRLHAACVDLNGKRLVLVGDSGSGKTTTALHLATQGAAIGCDESVLIRDGISIPVPRLLHVKSDAAEHNPVLRPAWDGLVQLPGTGVRCLDPVTLGLTWEVHAARIDALICLSGLTELPSSQRLDGRSALGVVMGQVLRCCEPRRTIVREVSTALNTGAWDVRGGGALTPVHFAW